MHRFLLEKGKALLKKLIDTAICLVVDLGFEHLLVLSKVLSLQGKI
jgi:hypothetical protein